MSSSGTFTEIHQSTKSYKHMWAREVAKSTMAYDLKGVIQLIRQSALKLEITGEENIGQLREITKGLTGGGFVPEKPGKIDVGIVGAGVAGLFTALLFDWLNQHPSLKDKGLKINYDILEAAGAERLGGRLYTHHFTDEEHDYYDVGAMRFPNNSIMKRTFQLFQYIGITQDTKPGLIPYYIKDIDGTCPSFFNDVRKVGNVWIEGADDPYQINLTLPDHGKIPQNLLRTDPGKLVSDALKVFIDKVRQQFQSAIEEREKETEEHERPQAKALWDLLMKADHMSVRQFLGSGQPWERELREKEQRARMERGDAAQPKDERFPLGPGYNFNTIEWLETATYGTGWYDQALTECVLEELDFHTDDADEDKKGIQYWWCIDGGAQEIAKKMASKVNKRIEYNTRVESIDAQVPSRTDPDKFTAMKIRTTRTDPKTKKTETKDRDYFSIFNSTTLAAFQRMELHSAGLSWGTKQAIRALGYGASSKVGMKFRTAWWQKAPFNIKKGGLARTDLPLRVCVYPSYNIEANQGGKHDPEKSAVLLCSYTWGQDAQRIGSLCSNNTPSNEEELKKTILHDLARLHANEEYPFEKLLELLEDQYVDHHAWDWYRDQNMSGAFAYFGPGQFSNMWQEIIKPNSFGQLYLVGEAASSHHAWIVGALESVVRAVYVMFQGLHSYQPGFEAYGIVLDLLRNAPLEESEDTDAPLKKNGAMPNGLPFHPLPEEMPTAQYQTPGDTFFTDNPEDEATTEKEMTYGAALAMLSLMESFFELLSSKR